MNALEGRGITKYYSHGKIIEDVSLFVKKGEIVSLLGASGVGKSTLFNIMSGLEECEEGSVFLAGEDITGKAGKVGYMQQNDLLLPFKRIVGNVMIPLRLKKLNKKEARKRAEEILCEFALIDSAEKFPHQLSGGMRQRAALARTFMTDCDVMLFDEPFSALDAITRNEMQKWFKETVKRHGISALFITHDIDEAIFLSDRVYVMAGYVGRIVAEFEVGEKEELKKKIEECIKNS